MQKHNSISTRKHLLLTHFQWFLAQAQIRKVPIINTILDVSMKVNFTWARPFWFLRAGAGGLSRPAGKKHAVSQNIFVHFTWNFLHILCWQYGISLDKKNWQMSLLSSIDEVIMKVMCWCFLSFLGIDAFFVTNGI